MGGPRGRGAEGVATGDPALRPRAPRERAAGPTPMLLGLPQAPPPAGG